MEAARRHLIVGREAERAQFQALLESAELPYCILNFYGPGGVGKTTLLRSFVDTCVASHVPVAYVDARNVESTPDGFLKALTSASVASEEFTLAEGGPRQVLVIDTYETLEALDGYFRDVLFPRFSSETVVVIAGRQPLSVAWQADPGWRPLLRSLALRNLAPDDSRLYLEQRDVPATRHQEALNFTHGHPLALSLIADVLTRPGSDFSTALRFVPEDAPDVVHTLLERFIERAPGPKHRAAVEICALVRHTDESLLGEMLGEASPEMNDEGEVEEVNAPLHEIFEWLRGLSFIESSAQGVFPHDIAREALIADLRWRNRDRYVELHHRARDYYAQRMKSAQGQNQQRLLYDAIFLHRDSAVVRTAFTWQESTSAYPDGIREGDVAAIKAMVETHEGVDSAQIAAGWLERQPDATVVFRDLADPGGGPVGFFTLLTLPHDSEPDMEPDPAVAAALRYLRRNAPLREGEVARHLRFWMARDSYQNPSPVQSLLIVHALRQFLLRSRLAFTFFVSADPELWAPVFEYVEIAALPDAGFTIGGHDYGVYGQDWRVLPANAWLARLFDREVAAGSLSESAPPAIPSPLIVLSEPEFAASVRDALKGYLQPGSLHSNPLLRSRLIVQTAGNDADTSGRVELLQKLILDSAELLKASPKTARGFRALFHTYIQPSPTQEQAADLLDLPFNTYRRHLGEGIQAVTRHLWQLETGKDN